MKKLLTCLLIAFLGCSMVFANEVALSGGGDDGVLRDRNPRPERPSRPSHGGFGKRISLGLSFGMGPNWLNPRSDSLNRGGVTLALKYGIPIDVNFTQKENYYFTTGLFFNHSGGKLAFNGIAAGTDNQLLPLTRQYSAIYVTIPTGIKLKTPSMDGFVIAANFGLYHSFRINAKASDQYSFQGDEVKSDKYMYTESAALFSETGFIGLGTEYVVSDNFRVYFYALYNHSFLNYFNPKNSNNLATGAKDKATVGGVELQIGLSF